MAILIWTWFFLFKICIFSSVYWKDLESIYNSNTHFVVSKYHFPLFKKILGKIADSNSSSNNMLDELGMYYTRKQGSYTKPMSRVKRRKCLHEVLPWVKDKSLNMVIDTAVLQPVPFFGVNTIILQLLELSDIMAHSCISHWEFLPETTAG